MIKALSKFYNDSGELVVNYAPEQETLYLQAHHEHWEIATKKELEHHSNELHIARNQIQEKYNEKGLLYDLFLLPYGIHKEKGNFCAMVLKHFLQDKGFNVLVSEEDYYLMSERGNRYKNDGFNIITQIFGVEKIDKLLFKASKRGDPDVFAFLDYDPKRAWFIEAKRPNENFTKGQIENFPHVRELLCPVEIARIEPLPGKNQKTTTYVPKEKPKKQNRKPIRYQIGKFGEYNERPTALKYGSSPISLIN